MLATCNSLVTIAQVLLVVYSIVLHNYRTSYLYILDKHFLIFYSASESRTRLHNVSLALTVAQRLFTAIYLSIYCMCTHMYIHMYILIDMPGTTAGCLMLTFMLPSLRGLCTFSCIIEHIRALPLFTHFHDFLHFPPFSLVSCLHETARGA